MTPGEGATLDQDPVLERSEAAAAPSAEDLTAILQQIQGGDLDGLSALGRQEQKWKIIPFGNLKIAFDDNIFIAQTNKDSDFIFTLAPGLAVGWGDYTREVSQLEDFERYFEPLSLEIALPSSFFFAKYQAIASFYTDHSDLNAVDHDALISGRWVGNKFTLAGRFRFQTLSGISIDAGGRLDRQVYTGNVTSQYTISDKTSVELNLDGTAYEIADGGSSAEYRLGSWLNYQAFPKTQVAIGGVAGVLFLEGADDQYFQQLLARANYRVSSKLALSVNGGAEWRQFGGAVDDKLYGIFELGATYSPFDGTSISLNAFRRNSASISVFNETVTATGVSGRVSQRFFQRVRLVLEASYQNGVYTPDLPEELQGLVADREDDTLSVRSSVNVEVTKNVGAEVGYQHQRNDSSFQGFSFDENLVSFRVNFQF